MYRLLRFDGLWTPQGWVEPAFVQVDRTGRIQGIDEAPLPTGALGRRPRLVVVPGYAIPGAINCHSHAFQYALAGRAEGGVAGADEDFWSWRRRMYDLASTISPDQLEAVATMAYFEMARRGITHVVEFHYLHKDPAGEMYANPAEMGTRLIAAAAEVGLRLTLVPVFYHWGGFGVEATQEQRRFVLKDLDEYARLIDATRDALRSYKGAHLGVGAHSLRAASPGQVRSLAEGYPDLPFHLHVAEQTGEVEECEAFLGTRPIRWLLDNLDLTSRFSLVHATHVTEAERRDLAHTEARVVLCPTTEANLGDGIFPLAAFDREGGSWCLGTDSHVNVDPWVELRLADYTQRLVHRRRDPLRDDEGRDSAESVLPGLIRAARGAALGGVVETEGRSLWGNPYLDVAVFDRSSPLIGSASPRERLATLIYGTDALGLLGTMVGGRWVAESRRRKTQDRLAGTVTPHFAALRC